MILRITEICKQKKMSKKALAEKVGMSAVGLSKAINGNPTLNTLHKIADALDVKVWDLFVKGKNIVCPKCKGVGFSMKKSPIPNMDVSTMSFNCNGCGYALCDDLENDVVMKISLMSGFEIVSIK